MTQEKFIKVLDHEDYSYEIEGDKIVVTCEGNAWLESLTSLPPGVEFKNTGYVRLNSLVGGWVGGWVDEWSGNIKGIESKRLLNLTIKQGMFI